MTYIEDKVEATIHIRLKNKATNYYVVKIKATTQLALNISLKMRLNPSKQQNHKFSSIFLSTSACSSCETREKRQ